MTKTVNERCFGVREVTKVVGDGSIANPVRRVYEYYNLDGELIAVRDTNHLKGDVVSA